jgi:O-antigen/teichoic acid export membrane protein
VRRGLLSTFSSSLLIQAAGVGSGLLTSRLLGVTGKGQLQTIIVWSATMVYLGTLGLAEATAYGAAKDAGERRDVFATSQALAIGLGVVITLAGWFILPRVFASQGAIGGDARHFLAWYATPCLISLCAVAYLQGCGWWTWFNVSRTAVHIVTLAVMLGIWFSRSVSVSHFAAAYLAGNLAPPVIALVGIAVNGGWYWRPSLARARSMMRYGIKVQLGTWSSMANAQLDQLLLSVFFPSATLGAYAVAVTYATSANLLPSSVAQLSLPAVVSAHDGNEAAAVIERLFRWNLWLSAVSSLGLASLAWWVVPFVFGEGFRPAVSMAVILLLGAPAAASSTVLFSCFKACGLPEIASQASGLGLIVTVVLLSALLPHWGGIGAAVASACAYDIVCVFAVWRACRRLGLRPAHLLVPQDADWHALRTLSLRG